MKTITPTAGNASGWQYWKARGTSLHLELCAKLPSAHVRSLLKVLEGELLREEEGVGQRSEVRGQKPDGGAKGEELPLSERIYELVRGEDPRAARRALAIADAMITRQAMGKAAWHADDLYIELRREFEPGPLRMILTAAQRASKRAGKTGTAD